MSRYTNLNGSKKISEDFGNINTGFDKVQQEMDVNIADISKQHERINNLVVNGDSSPQAADAMYSTPKGELFDSLKDRVDATDTDVITLQAGKANKASRSLIVAIGDSLCAGAPTIWASFTIWLSHMLKANIVNKGIWGDWVNQVRARLQSDVIDLEPKYCIVLCGTNDLAGVRSLTDILDDVVWIIKELLKNNVEPIFISVPPRADMPETLQKIREYNYALQKICLDYDVKFVNVYNAVSNSDGTAKSNILLPTDNLHWTAQGAYECAKEVYRVLETNQNLLDTGYRMNGDTAAYLLNGNFETNDDEFAASWTKSQQGTIFYSIEDNPKGGKWQVVEKKDSEVYFGGLEQPVLHLVNGKTYRIEHDIEFVGDNAADTYLYSAIILIDGNGDVIGGAYIFLSSAALKELSNLRLYLDFEYPVEAVSCKFSIFGTGGKFKFKLGRVTVKPV